MQSNNEKAFLALMRAGLWEQDVRLSEFDTISFNEIYRLAEEQSVVGLVAAGIEKIVDYKVPKDVALTFVGAALQLEQRNEEMNVFISKLIERMRKEDIFAVLVKGQGIAQCYRRPLWRSAGDVDLLLSNSNYSKSKIFFDNLTNNTKQASQKNQERQHLEYTVESWVVELHGTLHTNLSKRLDRVIDKVQNDVFYGGNVRSWNNKWTTIFLPNENNDVVFIFTHILQHFFSEGIGLRQLCDLARLLHSYKESIDQKLLYQRLSEMHLLSEWKVFGNFLVSYLGLPEEEMPFYEDKHQRKAEMILYYILDSGNFGHKKDYSYFTKHNFLVRKLITFGRRTCDSLKLSRIFPFDSMAFLARFYKDGVKAFLRGE